MKKCLLAFLILIAALFGLAIYQYVPYFHQDTLVDIGEENDVKVSYVKQSVAQFEDGTKWAVIVYSFHNERRLEDGTPFSAIAMGTVADCSRSNINVEYYLLYSKTSDGVKPSKLFRNSDAVQGKSPPNISQRIAKAFLCSDTDKSPK